LTYALGCPFWSFPAWRGTLYTPDARPAEFLAQYARVFGTVEGNTTFWSVPSPRSVERWREAVPPSFRFCLKLPREITHDRMLQASGPEVTNFLRVVEPLGERLGPFMIQLPPAFGPAHMHELRRFLDALSRNFSWAVEFRHLAFYEEADVVRRCDDWLEEFGLSRAIMDTRALRAGDPGHPEVQAALHKKPDLPLRESPVGRRPLVRMVAHPEASANEGFLEEWASRIAGWIARGLEPFFFVHTPSNLRTPELAREVHRRIAKRVELNSLPAFPGESGETASGQMPLL